MSTIQLETSNDDTTTTTHCTNTNQTTTNTAVRSDTPQSELETQTGTTTTTTHTKRKISNDETELPAHTKKAKPSQSATLTPETATATATAANDVQSSSNTTVIEDLCTSILDLKPNARLEVRWDLITDEESETTTTRWWGATLLPNADADNTSPPPSRYHLLDDDATGDAVRIPIRTLRYDAYPDGGYPETACQEVAFLSDELLFDIEAGDSCVWRREGQSVPATSQTTSQTTHTDQGVDLEYDGSREGLRNLVDTVLSDVLMGLQTRMKHLTRMQQTVMADKFVKGKEAFVEKMWKLTEDTKGVNGNGEGDGVGGVGMQVITPEHIRMCMREVGQELAM
eukprot:CAMPEP_0194411960 /NCGR_PEP_ID=MMETSP0176-20130528/10302_1 /TAXON_ID=216777 /ORGANISM="Proboscia alata, Strain PI-D3" /LENGTH=340 /DNA_ID=CAMNT_0039214365 /DNA_START=36 /DNA_END=1058 /DNA_ORIENTATION=-